MERMSRNIEEILQEVWPDYVLGEWLGGGSFGTVYEATRRDGVASTPSAIKVITVPSSRKEVEDRRLEDPQGDRTYEYFQGVVDSYKREIKLMDVLRTDPHVVNIEDYKVYKAPDEMLWYIFIRMPKLTPLHQDMMTWPRTGPELEDRIVKLGADMCRALESCRRYKIIHRDIKPENIFVTPQGDYRLGDFGEARDLMRSIRWLSKKGTPNFMAPELYERKPITDFRGAGLVDLYSLGMVLYFAANGMHLPFIPADRQLVSAETRDEAFDKRIRGEPLPPPANVTPGLGKIILRALSYDPDTRYAGPREMREALEEYDRDTRDTPLLQEMEKWTEEVIGDRVVKLGMDLCRALESGRGATHGAIRPENIFVSPRGDFYLGDSGTGPARDETLEDSPARGETLEDSPARDETLEDSPVRGETLEDSPARDETLEDSPVREETLEHRPALVEPLENSHVPDRTQKNRPAREETLEDRPVRERTMEDLPAGERTLEDRPVRGPDRGAAREYMPPEALNGKSAGSQAEDRYALGMVLYYAANGRRLPFMPADGRRLAPGDREKAISLRMRGKRLPPPKYVSRDLGKVILRALAHRPGKRYADLKEFREALARRRPDSGRRPWAAAAAAVCLTAALGVGAWQVPTIRDWVRGVFEQIRGKGKDDGVPPEVTGEDPVVRDSFILAVLKDKGIPWPETEEERASALEQLPPYMDDYLYVGLKGDLDGDGEIKVNDFVILQRLLEGNGDVNAERYANGDMNGDYQVTSADLLMLQ